MIINPSKVEYAVAPLLTSATRRASSPSSTHFAEASSHFTVSALVTHKEDEEVLAAVQAAPRNVVPLIRVIVSPATALL